MSIVFLLVVTRYWSVIVVGRHEMYGTSLCYMLFRDAPSRPMQPVQATRRWIPCMVTKIHDSETGTPEHINIVSMKTWCCKETITPDKSDMWYYSNTWHYELLFIKILFCISTLVTFIFSKKFIHQGFEAPFLIQVFLCQVIYKTLQWRHNERAGVSNHQPHDCLLKRLFRHRSKTTSKLHVTGLCGGNSPVTGEFPTQRASNAENVSIWWRHHGSPLLRSRSLEDVITSRRVTQLQNLPIIWQGLSLRLTPTVVLFDSKVHGANMGPIWGRQDPGGPHVGPVNFAIWAVKADWHRSHRCRR